MLGVGLGEDERFPGIAKKQAVTDARRAALQQLRVLLVDGGRHRGGETRVSVLDRQEQEIDTAVAEAEAVEGFSELYGDIDASDAVKRHRAEEKKAGFYLPPVASMPDGWK